MYLTYSVNCVKKKKSYEKIKTTAETKKKLELTATKDIFDSQCIIYKEWAAQCFEKKKRFCNTRKKRLVIFV